MIKVGKKISKPRETGESSFRLHQLDMVKHWLVRWLVGVNGTFSKNTLYRAIKKD